MAHDDVGLAVAGVARGVLSGTAVVTAALWGVRSLQVGPAPLPPPADRPDLGSPVALLFLIGSLGGPLFAAVVTWRTLAPLGSTYRQGGLSIVAAFATVVLATVLSFPLDRVLGRWALLGAALGTALLARWPARAARTLGRGDRG